MVSVRIPPDVLAAAKARAETEDRYLTEVIVTLLERYGRGVGK